MKKLTTAIVASAAALVIVVAAIIGIVVKHGSEISSQAETLAADVSQTTAEAISKESETFHIGGNTELETNTDVSAEAGAETSAYSATTKVATTAATAAGTYEYSYAGYNPKVADMHEDDDDWELILVNRDYMIPDGYVPELAHSVEGDENSKLLDARVAPHYNEMYLAAKEDGITLTTVSGYRSYTLQKNNFENKISKYENQGMGRTEATQAAAKIILPPGTSEHNAGLAMDICSLEQSFENTKEFEWLKEHAEDYGFILRYPEDKQDITEIIYEPWHWRYVGIENAKKINASGLTLEEYLGVK